LINNKTVIAVILARGGSKGLPRKNIRHVGGKPLVVWTIEAGQKSKYIDRLILSSEDLEIINIAKKYNCEVPFVRPDYLAADDTKSIDVILDVLNKLQEKYDYVVLLQPTSPLRLPEDIDNAIKLCINQNVNACVSLTEPSKSPYWMFKLNVDGYLRQLIKQKARPHRRQDLPKSYAVNGAVYIAKVGWLSRTKNFLTDETIAYLMPTERSVDIDSEIDLVLCDALLKKKDN
jgi:N-acylneuraminate cytidylyltransferase